MHARTPNTRNFDPTTGDDFIFGSANADVIAGREGADTIYGFGDDDTLDGDSQDDDIHGGSGFDTIDGGSGDDTLDGDDGGDQIFGGSGDDHLRGGGEEDTLIGGVGTDRMDGGDNGDSFIWDDGDGSDVIDGGTGLDVTYVTGSNTGTTSAFTGEIFYLSANTTDTIGAAPDLVPLATHAIFQRTNETPFSLQLDNMEVLDISGGGGADYLQVGNLAGTGIEQVILRGGDGSERLDGINTFTPIRAFGDGGSDFLSGGQGNDELDGGDRGDRINGQGGDDVINGDELDDTLAGGTGNDFINGGTGQDGIIGQAGDDTLRGGDDADDFRFDGGHGNDVVQDFNRFIDDVFLGPAFSLATLDDNGDNRLDDADASTSVVDGNLRVDTEAGSSITILGLSTGLVFGDNLFFV